MWCVYIGETGHRIENRLKEHARGVESEQKIHYMYNTFFKWGKIYRPVNSFWDNYINKCVSYMRLDILKELKKIANTLMNINTKFSKEKWSIIL